MPYLLSTFRKKSFLLDYDHQMFTVIKSQIFCQDAVDAKKAEPDRYIIEAWAMVSHFSINPSHCVQLLVINVG